MKALFALASSLPLVAATAHADQFDPKLDDLFEQLNAPGSDAGEAREIEAEIEERWFAAPETGIAVLFDRAVMALNDRDPALAVVLTGHVTGLAPSFAEGWVLAGHAYAAAGQSQDAARAYAEAVKLEPRHFTAIARLGDLAVEAGDKTAGLSRYREALLINPHLSSVRARAATLRDEAAQPEI